MKKNILMVLCVVAVMSLGGCGDKNENVTSLNAKETMETKENVETKENAETKEIKDTKIEASTDKAEWLKVPKKLCHATGNFPKEILMEADEDCKYTVSSKIVGKELKDVNQFHTLSGMSTSLNENNEVEIKEKNGFIYRPVYIWREKGDVIEIKVYKDGVVKKVEWIIVTCDDDDYYLAEDVGGIKGESLNQEAIDKYFNDNILKKAVDTP